MMRGLLKWIVVGLLASPLAAQTELSRSTTPVVERLGYYSGRAYGVVPSSVDGSTKFSELLTKVYNDGGGIIQLEAGTYRIDSKIEIPNDGETSSPRQPPIIIEGAGQWYDGHWELDVPSGAGTILDLRFEGTPARIVTKGYGQFTLRNLMIKNGGLVTNETPFLLTTNTTLICDGVTFRGFEREDADQVNNDQDAILLGGNDTDVGNKSTLEDDAAFQGYGTIIERCFFQACRRAVYFRNNANHVLVKDCSVSANCGGTAAIEADAYNGQNIVGTILQNNLFEISNYTYGIQLQDTERWTLIGNGFYDPGDNFTACVRLEDDAKYHTIVAGYYAATVPYISDGTTSSYGNFFDPHYQGFNRFQAPVDVYSGVRQPQNNRAAIYTRESLSITAGDYDGNVTITKTNGFAQYAFVTGDTITLTAPAELAGTYTIASRVDASNITLSADIGDAASGTVAGTLTNYKPVLTLDSSHNLIIGGNQTGQGTGGRVRFYVQANQIADIYRSGSQNRLYLPGQGVIECANAGSSNGVKIGGTTAAGIGFHDKAPTAQRAGTAGSQDALSAISGGDAPTEAEHNAVITLVNELRAAMVEKGLIKGAD